MNTSIKTSLRILIVALFILSFAFCGCQSEIKNKNAKDLEKFMTEYNENCSYKYNGTILIAKGNEILLNEAYGTANFEEGALNIADSVFAIGSITKSFTAIAIMQLNERGLISLDDPISKYIDGNKRGDDISLHQLLTHTSGLGREGKYSQSKYVSIEENVDFINRCSMKYEPGEDFFYSNAGYIFLAAVVEEVSGQSYSDYIKENIFNPLDMEKSYCSMDGLHAVDQPIGYEILPSSHLKLSIYDFSCIAGCGNIYSTTQDMYKYYLGIKQNKLVSEESLEKIQTPYWGDWNYGYGYGWDTSTRYDYKKLSHGGCIGGGGYNSLMIMYPTEDYVFIFLTNNANRTALDAVSQSLEAIVFDKEYVMPDELKTVSVENDILKTYAGDYEFGNGIIVSVTYKNGKLFSTADDGSNYELIAIGENEFYYEDHQCTRCEFVVNQESRDVELVIRSKTYKISGNKVSK